MDAQDDVDRSPRNLLSRRKQILKGMLPLIKHL